MDKIKNPPTLIMRILFLFFVLCNSILLNGQNQSQIIPKYEYFTFKKILLKSNYELIVDTIADKRKIRLKGIATDIYLAYKSNPIKASGLNLGYLHFDTDSFFVISTVSASGLDTSIQVYRKDNGKLLIQGRLLYFHNQQHSISYYDYHAGNKLGIVNLITGKIETYPSPDVFCGFWHECVEKILLFDKEIHIVYYGKSNSMTKSVYIR